uniref:Uncharacterized protein n=1 Tax=Moniliophthora roreri TaxID=221103 RepID=A0A0W0F453_MONRR
MNCEHYDKELTTAIDASSERNRALYGCLVFLHGQRRQLLENVTRLDQHMGMLAQHISDNKTFTVTGAIAVPRPTLDVANLLLHIILPDSDPDGDRFATDEDVSPNDPTFLRKTPNVPIVSVWDDEDAELDDRDSPIDSRSNDPITHTTALLDKVHQELSVLCANWESTAPSTVWTMSARFATLIKLAISLDIVGTEEGLQELRNETIPAVHRLLTTIGDMIPRGTTPTMEMGNNERPQDPPLGDGIVVDMGSPKGPRVFRRIDRETEMRELREPQWQGEWLVGGQPIVLNV